MDALAYRCEILDRFYSTYKDDCLLIRYENVVNNCDCLLSLISTHFEVKIDPQLATHIQKDTSLAANTYRQKSLMTFGECDEASQIHGDHIFRAEVEGWRNKMSDAELKQLEIKISNPLKFWGYKLAFS